jgi:hypothetical protein
MPRGNRSRRSKARIRRTALPADLGSEPASKPARLIPGHA